MIAQRQHVLLDGDLADGIAAHGHREVLYMDGDRRGIVDHLCASTRPGDLVLTLGAGDVWKIGEDLLRRRRGGSAAGV